MTYLFVGGCMHGKSAPYHDPPAFIDIPLFRASGLVYHRYRIIRHEARAVFVGEVAG
jgi:hypothetical protein